MNVVIQQKSISSIMYVGIWKILMMSHEFKKFSHFSILHTITFILYSQCLIVWQCHKVQNVLLPTMNIMKTSGVIFCCFCIMNANFGLTDGFHLRGNNIGNYVFVVWYITKKSAMFKFCVVVILFVNIRNYVFEKI